MTVRAVVALVVLNVALVGIGGALLWGMGRWRSRLDVLRLSGVAYLLGVASMMIVWTLVLVAGIPLRGATFVASGALVALVGIAVAALRTPMHPVTQRATTSVPHPTVVAALFAAGIVALLFALFRASRLAGLPGEWDGWAFWVPRAELIYLFGGLDEQLAAFMPEKSQSYPPGLPALNAAAFHALGSADTVTLHLQHWFLVAGSVGAFVGLLGSRVRQTILFPLLLLVLVMPSLVDRLTSTYADVPLGLMTAAAALAVLLWIDERETWQLFTGTVLLAGAMLTKREGILFAACIVAAGLAASWGTRRSTWPRLAVAGSTAFALALPWRAWFLANDLPSDGPDAGYLGAFDHTDRIWPSTKLVVETFLDSGLWLVGPPIAIAAIVLAALAGARTPALYAGVFTLAALAGAVWVNWSNPVLPFSQEDHENPIVRLLGTPMLVLGVMSPLLLDRAWTGAGAHKPLASSLVRAVRPFIVPSRFAWVVILAVLLAFPASVVAGYSGQTLPGGAPTYPSADDCVQVPESRDRVRVVVGYADSYPEAHALAARTRQEGPVRTRLEQDGCGRVRVAVDRRLTIDDARVLAGRLSQLGLRPSIERYPGG